MYHSPFFKKRNKNKNNKNKNKLLLPRYLSPEATAISILNDFVFEV